MARTLRLATWFGKPVLKRAACTWLAVRNSCIAMTPPASKCKKTCLTGKEIVSSICIADKPVRTVGLVQVIPLMLPPDEGSMNLQGERPAHQHGQEFSSGLRCLPERRSRG